MPETIVREEFNPQRKDPCFCNSGLRFKSCCGLLSGSRKPPNGLHIVENFLTADECHDMVALAETLPRKRLEVLDLASSSVDEPAWMFDPGRVTEAVNLGEHRAILRGWMREAAKRHMEPVYGHDIEWYEDPRMLRYESGGRYDAHSDSDNYHKDRGAWCKDHDRDVSLLLYLNDDFVGGKLHFTRFNYRYTPKAGDLVSFPSDMRYKHAAETLESGIRYAVVSWMAFKDSPRVMALPPEDAITF